MLSYPGSYVQMGIMRLIPREAVGLQYFGSNERAGTKDGSYNLTVLGTVLLGSVLWWEGSWSSRTLAIIASASLVIAFLVDREPFAQKLSLRALGSQCAAYAHLALLVFKDSACYFAATLVAFILLEPVARTYGLWSSFTLPAAYALFLAVRLPYVCFLLATVRRRWRGKLAPFVIQKSNFRSIPHAIRHIVWSFFMGNVGLTVRCAKQLAILGLLSLLAGTLPERISEELPYAWVLGVGIVCAVVYSQGALLDALYYKIHRTMHASRELYVGLHRIHHKATVPTLLDAGTESPCELILTEYNSPIHVLLPSVLYFLIEISLFIGQMQGHLTRQFLGADGNVYLSAHVDHHRLVTFNFSCGSEPDPAETRFERPFSVVSVEESF